MSEVQQESERIQPLEGEGPWLVLHERYGFLEEAPPEDDCLLLSNQRLIGFSRREGQRRWTLLSLQAVDAVEVTDVARSLRPLLTGVLLVLGAAALVWLAAVFSMGGVLSWLIGGVLVLLGAITASTYFVAEETATITFRTRTTEVSLALRTPQAVRDAYTMAQGLFQAKAGQGANGPAPGAASYPQESAQVELPGQPAYAPTPGMTPHQQESESTQAEGWRDV